MCAIVTAFSPSVFEKPCLVAAARANDNQQHTVCGPDPCPRRVHSRDKLLSLSNPQVTVPARSVSDRWNQFKIHAHHGSCFRKLGKKRSYRAGRRKTKSRKFPVVTTSITDSVHCFAHHRSTKINFDNLIPIPLSSRASNHISSKDKLHIAVFCTQSIGPKQKRIEIANFVTDRSLDMFFNTETMPRQSCDEAKVAELAPPPVIR